MSLKFLLDENIPSSVFKFLKIKGYKAFYVPKGAKDRNVAELAKREKAVLVTRDYDFANILLYPPQEFHGIIILKVHPPVAEKLISSMKSVLKAAEDFRGKVFVVLEDRIRVLE
jgi:predicted nuclease of predicted toxin-antitoxin system